MESAKRLIFKFLKERRWSSFIGGVALLFISFFAGMNLTGPAIAWGQAVAIPTDKTQIKVSVNLIYTPVVVRDAHGALITGLTKDNFRLFDDGVQQTLEDVEVGGPPLALALVIETSSRVVGLLPVIRHTGLMFTQKIVGETGAAALIKYSDQVETLCNFSNDHNLIEKSIAGLHLGTSGANLYDALSLAVDMLSNAPPPRRRVIITLAEGMNTGSEEKLAKVVREAQISGITIYFIGLSTARAEVSAPVQQAASLPMTPSGTFGLPPVPGSAYTPGMQQLRSGNMDLGALVRHTWSFIARQPSLEAAVSATGGLYQPTYDDDSIERTIDQISAELYTQYVVSFQSKSNETTRDFHNMKVMVVRPPETYKARSRPVYYMSLPQ